MEGGGVRQTFISAWRIL